MTEITLDEIKNKFAINTTREEIFNGYLDYLQVLLSKLSICEQFIDGSFMTNKKEPNDIDVVTFLDIGFIIANKKFLVPLKSENAIINYKVDGYFCPTCEVNSPYSAMCQERLNYWIRWFGSDRAGRKKELFTSKITKDDIC